MSTVCLRRGRVEAQLEIMESGVFRMFFCYPTKVNPRWGRGVNPRVFGLSYKMDRVLAS